MCKLRLLAVGLGAMAGSLQLPMVAADGDNADSYGHLLDQPEGYTAVFAALFGAYLAYIIITYSAFIYRALYLRDKSLLERSVFLLTAYTISGTILVTNVMVRGFLANYPCFVDIGLLTFGYIMWATTIILYMARYYVIVRLHKSIENQARVNPVTPDNLVEYMMRLRLATHRVFWQNIPESNEPASTNRQPAAVQNTGVR
ncbi:hypothetical protein IWW38_002417, partial [Coemansia aciculifera]